MFQNVNKTTIQFYDDLHQLGKKKERELENEEEMRWEEEIKTC